MPQRPRERYPSVERLAQESNFQRGAPSHDHYSLNSTSRPSDGGHTFQSIHHDTPPPRRPRPLLSTSHSNIKVKRSWPPSPAVEDDGVSFSREVNPPSADDGDRSEARSRGSLDQQPIIVEAEGSGDGTLDIQWDLESQTIMPNTTPENCMGGRLRNPTEFSGMGYRQEDCSTDNMSQDDFELLETPLFSRRDPTPYVYMPKAPDSGYFSSPGFKSPAMATPLSDRSREYQAVDGNGLSDALRGNGKFRNRSSDDLENAYDVEEISTQSSRSRESARYSFSGTDLQRNELRHFIKETVYKTEAPPRPADLKPHTSIDPRRKSDCTPQQPRYEDNGRGLVPLRASVDTPFSVMPNSTPNFGLISGGYVGTSSHSRPSAQRTSFPIPPSQNFPPSPPYSPQGGPIQNKANSPRSGRSSATGSNYSSRPVSPLTGPPSSRYEESHFRSLTLPIRPDDRLHRSPRLLGPSSPPDSGSSGPHIHVLSASPEAIRGPLPYPLADLGLMPSEDRHKSRPPPLENIFVPRISTQGLSMSPHYPAFDQSPGRPGMNVRFGLHETPISPRNPASQHALHHPVTSSRHSIDGEFARFGYITETTSPRVKSNPTSPGGSVASPPRPLIQCPRVEPSNAYDDWYNLANCPTFNICPTCFESEFSSGVLRRHFKPSPLKISDQITKCDFGDSKWFRLAWLITKQNRWLDVDLLYQVARIDSRQEPCPGQDDETRTWYTLLDERGQAIDNFDICFCDVRKIEALLPSFRGNFVPSSSSGRSRKCNMRLDNACFQEYLDLLIDIDAVATRRQKQSDVSRFSELVRQRAQVRHCPRDTTLYDQRWHFHPSLPEFTVCKECYSTVIEPALVDGCPFASGFYRTPRLVEQGKRNSRTTARDNMGASCQLYSPRMREIFDTAVRRNDFPHLAHYVKERRARQISLQEETYRLQMMEQDVIKACGKAGLKGDWQTHPQFGGLKRSIEKNRAAWKMLE